MLKFKETLVTLVLLPTTLFTASACHAELQDDIHNKGLKNNVEIKMFLKRGVPSANIDAHVDHNIIQLAGFVDNLEQYKSVALVAANYSNAYKVINNVKILSKKDHASDEQRLKHDIERQLFEHKYPVDNIDIQVRNGHVILSGFVNRHVELGNVTLLSQAVPGAKQVDNYILYKQA